MLKWIHSIILLGVSMGLRIIEVSVGVKVGVSLGDKLTKCFLEELNFLFLNKFYLFFF